MEFPSVGQIWVAQERRGARVAWVPTRAGVIDVAQYDDAITDDTVLVSAAHAYYLNGCIQDIAAIIRLAHDRGALCFVDAYQACGAVPIDVKASAVDLLASGNLKYLMGVPGSAFLYVRRDIIERFEPTVTGWFGRANPFTFDAKTIDWSKTASRFETGTPPLINAYIARAGMELIGDVGVDRIRAWHRVLAQRLIDGGAARGLALHGSADTSLRTANTAFVVDDAHAIETMLRERGVLASARGPVIRLAPHFYNTIDDVDTALAALASCLNTR
jgi:selenocysteine lyase/cysteine desulfurase